MGQCSLPADRWRQCPQLDEQHSWPPTFIAAAETVFLHSDICAVLHSKLMNITHHALSPALKSCTFMFQIPNIYFYILAKVVYGQSPTVWFMVWSGQSPTVQPMVRSGQPSIAQSTVRRGQPLTVRSTVRSGQSPTAWFTVRSGQPSTVQSTVRSGQPSTVRSTVRSGQSSTA